MIVSRSRAVLVGALLVGAGSCARAEEAAPLQESKQVLRQLQKEQAQRAATPDGVKGALPQIDAPDMSNAAGGLPAPPMPAQKRREEEAARKRPADRNWLVEGMLRLEGKSPTAVVPGAEEEDDETLDASDPDFLLKTYIREQRARTEGESRQARERPPADPAADPMAPFLQQWLSGSPVEKLALGTAAGSGAGTRGTVPPPGGPLGAPDAGRAVELFTAPGGADPGSVLPGAGRAAENPFLRGLELGGAADPSGWRSPVPDVSVPAVAPRPPVPLPPVHQPRPEVAPGARATDRKPPPSALKENEKYFPQQKKF